MCMNFMSDNTFNLIKTLTLLSCLCDTPLHEYPRDLRPGIYAAMSLHENRKAVNASTGTVVFAC